MISSAMNPAAAPLTIGDLARAANVPTSTVRCTGNSARSQMAEALLRKHKGDRVVAASAGTDPKPRVHPLAVREMAEVGIDIAAHRPKDAAEFLGRTPVAHVLIVCDNANQSCPRVWPGAFSRTFMPFDDPAAAAGSEAEQLAVFRRVRDEIDAALRAWEPPAAGGAKQ
jgi:arsenate reductase